MWFHTNTLAVPALPSRFRFAHKHQEIQYKADKQKQYEYLMLSCLHFLKNRFKKYFIEIKAITTFSKVSQIIPSLERYSKVILSIGVR